MEAVGGEMESQGCNQMGEDLGYSCVSPASSKVWQKHLNIQKLRQTGSLDHVLKLEDMGDREAIESRGWIQMTGR